MKKPKFGDIDFILFGIIVLLTTIGVVMVYSASSYFAAFKYDNAEYFLWRQLLFACGGVGLMIITMNIDYHRYRKWSKIMAVVTVILLCVVFLFEDTNGAYRWIRLGPLSIQPSEIAKYVVVMLVAKRISLNTDKIKSLFKGMVPCLFIAAIYAGLILAENNLSIASVTVMVTIIMLFVAGSKMAHMFLMCGVAGALGAAAAILEPYRMLRVMNFMNPFEDAQGAGYQLVQSLLALGSGGLTGVGIGQSRQKCFYIPEPHNDFIFSVIGEELGFIGCLVIIILFILFLWRGVLAALKAKDFYGSLLATGITSVIIVQAIINIAVVSGSMPVTGVPLPFISSGGTSLVINLTFMGVLLNITRQNNYKASN